MRLELAGPEPIERAPRRSLVGKLVAFMVGSAKQKHSLLGIRQAQAHAKALGVLFDEHGERREPQRCIRRKSERLLYCDQPREAREPRHPTEQSGEEPIVEQRLDGTNRLRRDENAPKLPRHPFRRKPVETRAEPHAGGKTFRIERALAVIGVEAEEAEDAEIILFDARVCIADEADAPRDEIAIAAERVEHRPVACRIERVQGEVTPPRILLPILGEGDGRMPPISLYVAPKGRHLERHAVGNHRHRAMLDPGRHRLQPGPLGERHHAVRQRGRGEVDLGDGKAEQGVAHRAADGACLHSGFAQRGEHARRLWPLEPFSILERRRRRLAL